VKSKWQYPRHYPPSLNSWPCRPYFSVVDVDQGQGAIQDKNGGEYETFEAYCRGGDFTDRYARHLLASTRALENISTGTIVPPSVPERQARPLAKLEMLAKP